MILKEIINKKGYLVGMEFRDINTRKDLEKAKDVLDEYIKLYNNSQ